MIFDPLLTLARKAKRHNMPMQCDPQSVLNMAAENARLRARVAELEQYNKTLDAENARLLADCEDAHRALSELKGN